MVTGWEVPVLRVEGSSNLYLKTRSTPMSQTAASVTPISPLRRRMIEDMTIRGFGEKTQTARMPGPQPPRGKYPQLLPEQRDAVHGSQ